MRKKVRKLQKIACILLAIGILGLETAPISAVELSEVRADAQTELSTVAEDEGLVNATIVMPEIMPLAASGEIVGTGVMLRQGPSTSSPMLEMMDYGEPVVIDVTISSSVPGGYWYYVQRVKTGTKGWVSSAYVYRF